MSGSSSPTSNPWSTPPGIHPKTPPWINDLRDLIEHANQTALWAGRHFTLTAALLLLLVIIWARLRHHLGASDRLAKARTSRARNAAKKIGPKIGWKAGERFIKWPRDASRPGAKIVIRYPEGFAALDSQIAFIPEVIHSLVGGDWEVGHDALHNRLTYTRLGAPSQFPSSVWYTFRQEDRIDQIPIGVDIDGAPLVVDLTHKTPHVLLSASTGWGKTSTLSVFVAHPAGHGALVDICDPKQIGFIEAFEGLPNVRIHDDIADMVTVIERFRQDMEARYRAIRKRGGSERTDADGPMRVLVIDELGSFSDMCIDHWQAEGNKGATPDVFRSLKRILWQGRAAGFHVIAAAQQANAKALFGASDARDQYALRIASGPQSVEAWGMLFGRDRSRVDIEPVKGRAVVGISAEFATVQLAQVRPADARACALRGKASFSSSPVGVTDPIASVGNVVSLEKTGDVDIPDVVSTFPTFRIVKDDRIDETVSPARAESRVGRPAGRTPVRMECARCSHVYETRAAERTSVHCPKCGTSRRIPVGARQG